MIIIIAIIVMIIIIIIIIIIGGTFSYYVLTKLQNLDCPQVLLVMLYNLSELVNLKCSWE